MTIAMILAAGRGERLKVLTEKKPKALCIVKGKPLIEHHIINLANAGFEKIVINHAYLGGAIRQYVGDGKRWGVEICYSPEPPGGLETGGGIVKALPLLGNKPFITVNADIYTDFNFSELIDLNTKCMHIILTERNPALNHHGDFGLSNEMLLTNSSKDFIFSGIACYNPELFRECKQGRYSITPLIRSKAEQKLVTAKVYQGSWFDIGTLDRLEAANRDA